MWTEVGYNRAVDKGIGEIKKRFAEKDGIRLKKRKTFAERMDFLGFYF